MSIHFKNDIQKKWLNYGIATSFVFILILLFLLPAGYFDEGVSVCPSMAIYGKECLGCGLTRGTMHLLHGDWREAMYHNSLSIITTPIILLFGSYFCFRSIKNILT